MNAPISLPLPDAAAAVGLSIRTLTAAIKDGSLIAHHCGVKAVIFPDDLRDYITSLPTKPPAKKAS